MIILDKTKKNIKEWIQSGGLYIVLALLLIIIIVKEPSFLSIRNFRNILTQSSVRLIMAL
ncbi:MAG: galactose/methyl galactoside ABC transporter permease MglC, partial [Fusobacteriaceae bacterium]